MTLLGMGEDGHCASLFPGEPVLDVTDRLVVPSHAHYAPFERYTLTFPALDRSRLVLFFVLGANKAEALGCDRARRGSTERARTTDGRAT